MINNKNIEKVILEDKTIYLVKTAHISAQSVEDVKEAIGQLQPDMIAIELDQERFESMTQQKKWQETDILRVIKEKKVGFLLANMILSSFQRRMAKNLDSSAGGEMKIAIELSQDKNIPLAFIDRPVNITFSRIWASLGAWEKAKLVSTILFSLFDKEEINEEDLHSLKQSAMLEVALQEVGKEFPVMKRILVDERDAYLAGKIKEIPSQTVVAVIGAAHAPGIKKELHQAQQLNQLEEIPKKKGIQTYFKWGIPLLLIVLVLTTLYLNQDLAISQLTSWLWWNGSLAAVGAILAAGHPLAVLTAFLLAPLTSLSPLLAVGWFAGVVQAIFSKPKVKDFENLTIDTEHWKGFWKNKVSRILLVAFLSNIFSSIATFIAGGQIIHQFLRLFS